VYEAFSAYEASASGLSRENLARLLAGGESETLELKRSTSELTSGMQTLCGMLNNRGGTVVFGVDDSGRIVGQQVSASTLEKVSTALREIEPAPPARIDRVEAEVGRPVVTVSVSPGNAPALLL